MNGLAVYWIVASVILLRVKRVSQGSLEVEELCFACSTEPTWVTENGAEQVLQCTSCNKTLTLASRTATLDYIVPYTDILDEEDEAIMAMRLGYRLAEEHVDPLEIVLALQEFQDAISTYALIGECRELPASIRVASS